MAARQIWTVGNRGNAVPMLEILTMLPSSVNSSTGCMADSPFELSQEKDSKEIAERTKAEEMKPRAQPLFAPDQLAHERALQEEREHPFHRQRLSDHSTGILREASPV